MFVNYVFFIYNVKNKKLNINKNYRIFININFLDNKINGIKL